LFTAILKLNYLMLHLPCWFLVVNCWSSLVVLYITKYNMNNALQWKQSVLCNSQWKASKQVAVKINIMVAHSYSLTALF